MPLVFQLSSGLHVSQVHCFGQRLLSPFQGVMQVISIDHGEAESMDGINWALYVNHEDIVSHTGMYEVRYGSWSQQNGLKLSIVRGTETNSVIDRVGQQLADAVENNEVHSPFSLLDCYECWIVIDDGLPLSLIDSVVSEDKKACMNHLTGIRVQLPLKSFNQNMAMLSS